jgi:hypothetical protein
MQNRINAILEQQAIAKIRDAFKTIKENTQILIAINATESKSLQRIDNGRYVFVKEAFALAESGPSLRPPFVPYEESKKDFTTYKFIPYMKLNRSSFLQLLLWLGVVLMYTSCKKNNDTDTAGPGEFYNLTMGQTDGMKIILNAEIPVTKTSSGNDYKAEIWHLDVDQDSIMDFDLVSYTQYPPFSSPSNTCYLKSLHDGALMQLSSVSPADYINMAKQDEYILDNGDTNRLIHWTYRSHSCTPVGSGDSIVISSPGFIPVLYTEKERLKQKEIFTTSESLAINGFRDDSVTRDYSMIAPDEFTATTDVYPHQCNVIPFNKEVFIGINVKEHLGWLKMISTGDGVYNQFTLIEMAIKK